jgi:hypothetical protein
VTLGHDLAPGEADHVVSGEAQIRVSPPIPLEGRLRVVELVAVELDHEALRLPERVYLVPSQPGVRRRCRQAGLPHERHESLLELASRERHRLVESQGLAKTAGSAPAAQPSEDVVYRPQVEQLEPLGLIKCAIQPVRGDGSEVEERPSHARDRDAVDLRAILPLNRACLVDLDPVCPPRSARRRDLRPPVGRWDQPP